MIFFRPCGLALIAALIAPLQTADAGSPHITRVSVGPDGRELAAASDQPALSRDGRWVAFVAHTPVPLTPEEEENTEAKSRDVHAVYLHDRVAGRTIAVSEHNDAAGQDWSFHPSVSANGRFVAYDRGVAGRRDACADIMSDVFLFDREAGKTFRISARPDGGWSNGDSYEPRISADGRFIAFLSDARDLVAGDAGGKLSAFLFDREVGRIVRVDRFVREAGRESRIEAVAISPSSRYVAFRRRLSIFADHAVRDQHEHYVWDRESEAAPAAVQTTLGDYDAISVDNEGRLHGGHVRYVRGRLEELGIDQPDLEGAALVSADGRVITFASDKSDLVSGDTNGVSDVFVADFDGEPSAPIPGASGPASPPAPPSSAASPP